MLAGSFLPRRRVERGDSVCRDGARGGLRRRPLLQLLPESLRENAGRVPAEHPTPRPL